MVNYQFMTFQDVKSGSGGKLKKKKTRTVFSRSQVNSIFICCWSSYVDSWNQIVFSGISVGVHLRHKTISLKFWTCRTCCVTTAFGNSGMLSEDFWEDVSKWLAHLGNRNFSKLHCSSHYYQLLLILLLEKETTSNFQVKIWFQNRRNKWKRQLAADNEASNLRAFSGVPLFLQATVAAGNLNAANLAQAAAQECFKLEQ